MGMVPGKETGGFGKERLAEQVTCRETQNPAPCSLGPRKTAPTASSPRLLRAPSTLLHQDQEGA